MASSILLVFEKPGANDPKAQQQWLGLTLNLKSIASNNKDIQILGENCLMLPIEKGLEIIHDVLHDSLGVSYKYLILPLEIEWHIVKK